MFLYKDLLRSIYNKFSTYKLSLVCISLWIIPFALSGQRYISGQITDAADSNPIPAATVFISNTTAAITTDIKGYYRLKIPGEGNYRLTVSHVGYQPVFKDIESGMTSMVFDVAMQIQELEEVNVTAHVRFRRTDINLFWRTIFGKNPSRRTIQATNPEAVYYYYNPETRILRVTCREPLHIINYETGYQIHYLLNSFTHDYNTDISDWNSQCIFTELEPENIRQQNNREKKRQEVYQVSLTKFIKSLYNNTLLNDGFVLAAFSQNPDMHNPFQQSFSSISIQSVLNQDSILSTKAVDNSKTLHFFNEQVMLICFGRPVNGNDLNMILNTPNIGLLQNRGLLINLLQGDAVRIYPDGTYSNRLQIAPVNASGSLTDLCMRLPVNYLPDESMPPVTADTVTETETENDFDSIVQHLDLQLNVFPQEKIHLHTDRDYYVPGEKIWFRAYLTDAATHQPSTRSRYVYVELISPADTLVSRVMIRPENEMFCGHLFLSEIIPDGNYTLRAYTRYMENLGDGYFFKKNIRIGNLASDRSQPSQTSQRNRTSSPANDDFDVSFFPEGGHLVDGVRCSIALKALNRSGYPETISGDIVDEGGSVIKSIRTFHAGMAIFSIMPEPGKRYFLKCRNQNGLEKQFELPQSESRAHALAVSQHNGRIAAGIKKSPHAPEIPCYLLAHCRGTVLYFAAWNRENESVSFSEETFPAGIIQFVLFDGQMNPLSERLVFSKNGAEVKVGFQTGKAVYEKREKVTAALIPSSSGRVGEGFNLSVAITDDADIAVDSSTTILSTLLLSSELKGYIENPAYYLQDSPESTAALDLLMMTHGWRRYNIPEVIRGKPAYPSIAYQTSQEISGQIKSLVRSRPVAGSEVLILVNDSDFGLTSSDAEGRFLFQGFEYPDSTAYFLRALSNRGSDRVELVLDGELFPKPVHAPQSPPLAPTLSRGEGEIKEVTKDEPESDAFTVKAGQRARYDEDIRVIQLGEVEVTAPRIVRKEELRLQYVFNKSADKTMRREDLEMFKFPVMSDYIDLVNRQYFNRGPVSLSGGAGRSIILDGMMVSNEEIANLSGDMIESIDIFNGVGATIFGTRGTNGVISITTRKGGENIRPERDESNYTVYTPLGYQKPVEFYSPKYETLEAKHLTIPDYRTTIFWKPDVVISDEEEKATFDFYTSDFPTTYSVAIEGLTTDGKIIRQVEKIQVE